MNEYDSIKWALNLCLSLLIGCLTIVTVLNLMHVISTHIWNWRLPIIAFFDYFMCDIFKSFNDESEMFLPKHIQISCFKVTRVIYCLEYEKRYQISKFFVTRIKHFYYA